VRVARQADSPHRQAGHFLATGLKACHVYEECAERNCSDTQLSNPTFDSFEIHRALRALELPFEEL
jgi:hypothetical protein